MKHFGALALAIALLAGCAAQAPVPTELPTLALPLQLHVLRQQGQQRQDWLLVIQAEGQDLRWSLIDPLSIPQARQVLHNGHWQADGLLPPNPEAREFFAALLFALTPSEQLATRYPQRGWSNDATARQWDQRWHIRYRAAKGIDIDVENGVSYKVDPLPTGSPP